MASLTNQKRDIVDRWLVPVLWLGLAIAGPLLLLALDRHRLNLVEATLTWILGALLAAMALLWQGRRRRRMERDLEESRRSLFRSQRLESVGRLAGGIAHDINNYLATIRAHCQLAAARPQPHEEIIGRMRTVEATVLKAASLVERLLTFGRRQLTRPEPVLWNEIIEDFEAMIRPSLDRGPSLEVEVDPELWLVEADVAQLEQLLANLFVNARDATPTSGHLTLRTRNLPTGTARPVEVPPGDFVVLSMSDTGPGIAPDVIEKIFDPFFTTKEGTGGSGLGLAVVHGIVEAAHGAVTVESRPGHGTTFHVFLPRHRPVKAPLPSRGAVRDAAGRGETILLVDDNTDLAGAIRAQLEQLGYRLLIAGSAPEALSLAEASSSGIDLVLTDVQLRSSTGPDLVAAIRRQRPVRALYMSGYTDRIALRTGPGRGDAYFLKKPFSADGLARMIRQLLDEPPPGAPPGTTAARPIAGLLAALWILAGSAAAQPSPSLDTFGLLIALESRPSFAVLGSGARAAGMGGAFTALADDASAVSFNPAGLALLVQPEASVVLDRLSRRESHSGFTAIEDEGPVDFSPSASAFDATAPNFAAFSYPLTVGGNNLSLQLSFHRLIDFTERSQRSLAESDAGGPISAELFQSVNQSGDLSTLSLAAAYQWTQRLSVGVTVSRWSGDWTFSTVTEERDLDSTQTSLLDFTQRNRWRGWNASVGALLRYRYLNVGATLRTPFDGDYDARSSLSTSFETPFADSSEVDATLRWPGSWAIGLALKPVETWVVTMDYTEFDWDDMVISDLGPQNPEPLNFFDLRPVSVSPVENTGQWRAGTEYTLIRGRQVIGLRAGAFDLPRPQVIGPGGEKSSLRGFSAGLGWKKGPWAFDVAYQRGSFEQATLEFVDPEILIGGQLSAQGVGKVSVTEERLFFSVLYRFASRAELRELAHFLFVAPKPKPAPPVDDGEHPEG